MGEDEARMIRSFGEQLVAALRTPYTDPDDSSSLEEDGFRVPSDEVVARQDALEHEFGERSCRDSVSERQRILIGETGAGTASRATCEPTAIECGRATICSSQLFARNNTALQSGEQLRAATSARVLANASSRRS